MEVWVQPVKDWCAQPLQILLDYRSQWLHTSPSRTSNLWKSQEGMSTFGADVFGQLARRSVHSTGKGTIRCLSEALLRPACSALASLSHRDMKNEIYQSQHQVAAELLETAPGAKSASALLAVRGVGQWRITHFCCCRPKIPLTVPGTGHRMNNFDSVRKRTLPKVCTELYCLPDIVFRTFSTSAASSQGRN